MPYLHSKQKKGQVEIHTRQNVFVRHCHHNRGAAVCEDGGHGVLCHGHASLGRGARGGRRSAELLGHRIVVIALLVVGHDVVKTGYRCAQRVHSRQDGREAKEQSAQAVSRLEGARMAVGRENEGQDGTGDRKRERCNQARVLEGRVADVRLLSQQSLVLPRGTLQRLQTSAG